MVYIWPVADLGEGPASSLILGKKEEIIDEGREASKANKAKLSSPSLAQGLDPPFTALIQLANINIEPQSPTPPYLQLMWNSEKPLIFPTSLYNLKQKWFPSPSVCFPLRFEKFCCL